jgi:hypothetical protein
MPSRPCIRGVKPSVVKTVEAGVGEIANETKTRPDTPLLFPMGQASTPGDYWIMFSVPYSSDLVLGLLQKPIIG